MTNGWERAREFARKRRLEIGENLSSEALLEKAFAEAKLRTRARRAADSLLHGAQAVLDIEAKTVWYRDDLSKQDKNLILAHELGHFDLHPPAFHILQTLPDPFPTDMSVGYGPRQRRETEANTYAREFLLPVQVARKAFEGGKNAHEIATQFGVPVGIVFAQLATAVSPDTLLPSDLPPGSAVPPPASEGGDDKVAFPLDPSQEEAARHLGSPLLVGAGPGTGKTRTLTGRLLYLTRECGVAAENILALTFSRKAAEEMRERIAGIAPEVAQRVSISTFHAYGLDLLRRHWRVAGLPPEPLLLTEADSLALLENRIGEWDFEALRYLHDPTFPLPDILRMISKAKEGLVSPEEFTRRAAKKAEFDMENREGEKLLEVGIAYAAYEKILQEKGAVDYADLIARSLRLLEEHPDVCDSERRQWRHVLVDEYQDVNRAGSRLVQLLTGDGSGLWVVGDLRQAIYAFRGASPANVTQFQQDFPTGERAELNVNYRSRPELVRFFGRLSGEGSEAWQANRTDKGATATMTAFPDEELQADFMADWMQKFHARGVDYGQQVVLCRTRNQTKDLRKRLEARGIPVAPGPNEKGLLVSPDVRKLLSLLSRICEPHSPGAHHWPTLPEGVPEGPDAYAILTEALWGKPRLAEKLTDFEAIYSLLTAAASFRERAELLLDEGEDKRRAFLAHFRRMARLGVTFSGSETTERPNPEIRILTVHASKGLEFPIVYLPGLSEGRFPPRKPPALLPEMPNESGNVDEEQTFDEEARLFFVALTRAKDHLVLTRSERYGKMYAKATPLLSRVVLPSAKISMEPKSSLVTPPALPPSADTPEQKAFSAADLELYTRCPKRYVYERELELPTGPPTAYTELRQTMMQESQKKEFTATLPGGISVTVEADAMTPDGSSLELWTLRKPPEAGTDTIPAERQHTLLRIALPDVEIQTRFLQDGQVLPVRKHASQQGRHIEKYQKAVEGIRLRVFPPEPESGPTECPTCPYFFICPDE
jgi:DNA helicase II / ATP-dependent DNA helicase PcrA